mmetsp:Transcript_13442/g.40656  ORF Transcript_13442/g.40656 Transcript_13442/m.40656 type:complete len:592 (+) Transcript_13442:190-1965(+)
MSFKARIIEYLLTKLRDIYRPVPTQPRYLATPQRQLSRQLSVGSALAAFRAATAEGRRDASRRSLLGACVAVIIADVTRHDLSVLPPDLVQAVLDGLVAAAVLSHDNVWRFRGLTLWQLRLGGPQGYPGVTDTWLTCFVAARLTVLDLGGCSQITDTGLLRLAGQSALTCLILNKCSITDASAPSIAGFQRLRNLSMRSCDGITHATIVRIGGLRELTHLNLEMCGAISGLRHLQGLKKLEELDLGWCHSVGSDDVASLAALTRLTRLEIARTRANNRAMGELAALTRLQRLGLAGTSIKDAGLALLTPLAALRDLSLDRCHRITDAGLVHLAGATALEELTVAFTGVGDGALQHLSGLTALQTLDLDSCSASDQGLRHLGALRELRVLNLSENGAVRDGGMAFLSRLRRLQSLDLSCTGVSDAGLEPLTPLSALTHLNLDTRHVTDAGLTHVARLVKLKALDLFGARISDAGCKQIRKLQELTSLELCGGGITDRGVAHLQGLNDLRSLSLSQNSGVGNKSLDVLAKLSQLASLNLKDCGVTGGDLYKLSTASALTVLALCETAAGDQEVARLQAVLPALTLKLEASTRR